MSKSNNIAGAQSFSYRKKRVGDSYGPSITANQSTILYINVTGAAEDWLIEKTSTKTPPTSSGYPARSIVEETQVNVSPTTQILFSNSPVTSATTFTSGNFVIHETFTESTPRPTGPLATLMIWRFLNAAGSPLTSNISTTMTEITSGFLESVNISAAQSYDISAGLYGSIEIVSLSAAISGTSVSNYDTGSKIISGCYGPSLLAPILTIGAQTQTSSGFSSSTRSFNVSCTADGMTHSDMNVNCISVWTRSSPISSISTTTTMVNISGNLWKCNTGIQPFGFVGFPRNCITHCIADDNFGAPGILAVQTSDITSSSF